MNEQPTILVVDNDKETRTSLRDYLEREGYCVVTEKYGQNIMEAFERTHPDLILLDVVLPDEDGVSLINKIRAKTAAPILVISDKADTVDKVIGLEMGADDYIEKPYEMRELAARIKANLRQVRNVEKHLEQDAENDNAQIAIFKFGNWTLDLNRFEFLDEKGRALDMTHGEMEMLKAFALSPRKALSRDQLFDITRGRDYEGFDRAVDVQISRIRQKIGDTERTNPYIRTVRGVGYMLDTDVKTIK